MNNSFAFTVLCLALMVNIRKKYYYNIFTLQILVLLGILCARHHLSGMCDHLSTASVSVLGERGDSGESSFSTYLSALSCGTLSRDFLRVSSRSSDNLRHRAENV